MRIRVTLTIETELSLSIAETQALFEKGLNHPDMKLLVVEGIGVADMEDEFLQCETEESDVSP